MKMEERSFTDEEIAKAILQQVEYNAGIPYIDEWKKVRTIKFTEILDFIYRLQNIEKANEEAWGIKEESYKRQIAEQKAEIERLENETTYLQRVADAFKGDYKNAKADGVRELLQELIEMEIKLDPLRSGIRYKALIGYAEENGIEVDL
jgi:hypothetical protein